MSSLTPEDRVNFSSLKQKFPNLTPEEKRTYFSLEKKLALEKPEGVSLSDFIKSIILGTKT